MPGGDRTGPLGIGPRTGRGAGFCSGTGIPGFANPVAGRGFGSGFGRGAFFGRCYGGRGWRNMFYATGLPGWLRAGSYSARGYDIDPETEKQFLKNQAESLQAQLDLINKRLAGLETKGQTD